MSNLHRVVVCVTLLFLQEVAGLRAAPPSVSSATLTAWLDAADVNGDGSSLANGAAVPIWVNKAAGGVGNFTLATGGSVDPAVVASSGAFNGQPVVRFTPYSGRRLQNTVNFGNNVTVIYVGRKSSSSSGRLVSSIANNWLLGYWTTRMNCSYWNGPGNYEGTAAADNAPHIWVGAANGSTFQVFRADVGAETLLESGGMGAGPNGLSLGGSSDEVGGGDIGELLVYNGALSQADRLSVESYLEAKWLPTAPFVDTPPQSFTAYVGEYASLSVSVAGIQPFSYQWRKSGSDIPNATNASYAFSGALTSNDSDSYTVVVTNSIGSVTSAPAVVVVLPVTAVSDALAGYWNFDEGTGALLIDNSGNGNDGALMNFPTDDTQWVAGQIGGALNFRGPANGDYVVVPNYPKPSAALTICAWVWADARPTWASIVKNWATETGGEIHFGLNYVEGDLSNYLIQQGGGFVGPVREGAANPLPLGSWQHVVLVCDGRTMQIYRNGTAVGSPLAYNGTINTNLTLQSLAIGAKLDATGVPPGTEDNGYWQGKMDDLGLWTRALSADEVLAVFVAGLNGAPLTDAIVGASAPVIGTPPQDVTITEGQTASFSVVAAGTPPLTYQWRRNGADISDATNTSLVLEGLCATDGASFDVVIRNIAGSITSTPPATLTVLPLTATQPITAGLIGHWPFNETAGSAALDASPYANHAYLTNFPADNSQWVAGQVGGALNFRGPGFGDYALVLDYPKPASNLTISAWVWADARPTWASIVKNWTDAGLEFHFGLNYVEGDLSNYLTEQDGDFVGPVREGPASPLPLGSWQHVALVCDGSKQQLYRNGVPVGLPLAYDGTINTNLSPMLAIGAKLQVDGTPPGSEDSGFWQGKMDDIGLWDRGLSAAEIQAIYNAGLDGRSLATASVLPTLGITRSGDSVVISWPATPAGNCYVLKWTPTLPATSWTPVGQTPVLSGGQFSVTVVGPADVRFYRLEK